MKGDLSTEGYGGNGHLRKWKMPKPAGNSNLSIRQQAGKWGVKMERT